MWAPERATNSSTVNPLWVKIWVIWGIGIEGFGKWPWTEEERETVPSRRPRKTGNWGPPNMTSRSRVEAARMSAQDTVCGHASSKAVLARTMRSKASPGSERLMSASRSAVLKGVEERRSEASQPLGRRQSWRKRRRVAGPVVGCEICLAVTVSAMIWLNCGHVLL